MDINVLISIFGAVIIAVIGYVFEKERERKTRLYERKENLYKNLVLSIKGFYVGKPNVNLKEQFINETQLARLYASDKAIRALNNLVDLLMKSEKTVKEKTGEDYQEVTHQCLGEFMLAMRRDLGIKTRLSPEELGRTETIT